MGVANIAVANMEHLCICDLHGYSQGERWGRSENGSCFVECDGHTSEFWIGDRDCSSAVIDAWQEALVDTAYEGTLRCNTTYDMKSGFLATGLFEWRPMTFTAQRGDVYLFIGDISEGTGHTAMCISPNPDMLAEFSISETGGIYGQRGDQTGAESSIHPYYDFPWDGILHYNGKADGARADQEQEAPDKGTVRRVLKWLSDNF